MADQKYIVVGAVAVLPTSDGSERYMYRGAVISTGFTETGIEHALSVGLIEEIAEPAPLVPPFPDGDPTEKWSVAELDAYAAAKGIDLPGQPNKGEKLVLIEQHSAAAAAERAAAEAARHGK